MLLFQVVKMAISSAHEPAGLRGDLEPCYAYGLGIPSWQVLAPRFCARRAAASGRSTGHGARMPSLQDLENGPRILAAEATGSCCIATRVALGLQRARYWTHPAADQECRDFSKPRRHRTPEFSITAAAASVAQPAESCRRPRAAVVTPPSAVQGPEPNLPPWQPPTILTTPAPYKSPADKHIPTMPK